MVDWTSDVDGIRESYSMNEERRTQNEELRNSLPAAAESSSFSILRSALFIHLPPTPIHGCTGVLVERRASAPTVFT
jgi:hypothetical protein